MMSQKKFIGWLLISFIAAFSDVAAQQIPYSDTSKTRTLELPKIQVVPLLDSISARQYELYIKTPDGYSKNDSVRYPVLYFTDAMWHIEILSGSSEYLMDNLILVGISWQKDERPEVSRFRDYTILKGMNPNYESGGASQHLSFIKERVIPFIESHYQTNEEARSYFGYSQGATFGAYIAITQPELFRNYVLGSPETLLDNSFIHHTVTNISERLFASETRIFISAGELELKDLIDQTTDFVSFINELENDKLKIDHRIIESADHKKAFPMTATLSMYWLTDQLKEGLTEH